MSVVSRLDDREKMIINMRFGIGGNEEHTQKEVADIMGISQSYISRLEKRIISKIKDTIIFPFFYAGTPREPDHSHLFRRGCTVKFSK